MVARAQRRTGGTGADIIPEHRETCNCVANSCLKSSGLARAFHGLCPPSSKQGPLIPLAPASIRLCTAPTYRTDLTDETFVTLVPKAHGRFVRSIHRLPGRAIIPELRADHKKPMTAGCRC